MGNAMLVCEIASGKRNSLLAKKVRDCEAVGQRFFPISKLKTHDLGSHLKWRHYILGYIGKLCKEFH